MNNAFKSNCESFFKESFYSTNTSSIGSERGKRVRRVGEKGRWSVLCKIIPNYSGKVILGHLNISLIGNKSVASFTDILFVSVTK